MNRRAFMYHIGAFAGGLTLGPLGFRAIQNARPALALPGKTGVQLYTLRSLMSDVAGTLKQVADIGYEYVELAGYADLEPAEFKQILDDLGLTACSGHFGARLFQEDADAVIEGAKTLGMTYVIVPSLGRQQRTSIDGFKTAAAWFNEWGEKCKAAGLQFGYHNHSFEFEEIDGQLPYKILLDETEPDLVKMQLDLCWIVNAGHDPLVYFERDPGRYPLCHVKDLDAEKKMTDVGQGVIDFPRIFAKSEQAGLEYFIVEHDHPEDPIKSIETAMAYLREVDGK